MELFAGSVAQNIARFDPEAGSEAVIAYRPFSRRTLGTNKAPRLRAIQKDGRIMAILSTEDLSAGLVGQYVDGVVGYSPERINPGDQQHTLDKIVKVVSGQDPAALERVARIYQTIATAGVFRAPSIRVAEAAKVMENIQRDLNIALMNELSIICDLMGLKTRDVLEAAGTKWNFLKFTPGLVGVSRGPSGGRDWMRTARSTSPRCTAPSGSLLTKNEISAGSGSAPWSSFPPVPVA